MLGLPRGEVATSRDGEENHPRRVVKARQGDAVVGGNEEVEIPSQHLLLPEGLSLLQVLVSSNVNIKHVLPVLNLSVNKNLSLT